MHGPRVVGILAHEWTTAISSAGIGFRFGAITSADHVIRVEAMFSAYNWHHSLLQNVRRSAWVSHGTPTSKIASGSVLWLLVLSWKADSLNSLGQQSGSFELNQSSIVPVIVGTICPSMVDEYFLNANVLNIPVVAASGVHAKADMEFLQSTFFRLLETVHAVSSC